MSCSIVYRVLLIPEKIGDIDMKPFEKFVGVCMIFSIFMIALIAIPEITSYGQDKPAAEAKADDAVEAKRLTRSQKRNLGILPRQVLSKAKQMVKDGDLDKDMTPREMAFSLAAEVSDSSEYGGAWEQVSDGTYGVDWDSIIVFLERLFELLIKFIPIFI